MICMPDTLLLCISLITGAVYALLDAFQQKRIPSLSDTLIVMTSVFALLKGGELVGNLIFNKIIVLGDLDSSKLVIVLGGVSIMWISFTTALRKFIFIFIPKAED